MQNDHHTQEHPRGSSPSQVTLELQFAQSFFDFPAAQTKGQIAPLFFAGVTTDRSGDDEGNGQDFGGEAG